jgi:hypothetical protein
MNPPYDPARARLLAARLGELAALGRPQVGQATPTRLPSVLAQQRKRVRAREEARDKLKAEEFLAGG